jgi:acyl-CoA synthetase (AMP-forming)/AMP-acid ligase II
MLKKLVEKYLNSNNKIIFTDKDGSYDRKELKKKVDYFKKIIIKKKIINRNLRGIAIYLDRDIDYFAIIFACWLCNIFYLPLSKNINKRDLNYQLKTCRANFLVFKKNKIIKFKKLNPIKIINPKLSYLIFTSGSTGEKKGVKITYKNFVSYLKSLKKKFKNNFKANSILINGEISFDIVNADIAFALLYDCEICITEDSKNILSFFQILENRRVESIYAVPSMWENICFFANTQNKKYSFIKQINSGGEVFSYQLFKKIKKMSPKAKIFNFYGPTEFTINSTCCELTSKKFSKNELVDENLNFSIGQPLPGVKIKISKNSELLLSGNQHMQGYINSKYKSQLINGIKYYSTGDLVKQDKNKNIFFLGRLKDYVKYKGFRINLQNISNIISNEINRITIVKIINNSLIAFIKENKKKIDIEKIKKKLNNKLDFNELPNEYKFLNDFPKTVNGKIDVNKLTI